MSDLAHAALIDRTYRHLRRIYDLTRGWFLPGRDHLIADLDLPAGGRVLDIACGTGRNLDHIARRYPGCDLYGLDISQQGTSKNRPVCAAGMESKGHEVAGV